MDERERTCFFISPIGEEDSVQRKNSDSVLYYLLIPVLSSFRFDVQHLRSDQDNSASITQEMRKKLREGDLCIADITGHNPNVMWECGYRAATGRELIVLCAEDDTEETIKPVFDMYDDRKIRYDYYTSSKRHDTRRRKATQQEIRERVQRFIDNESKSQPDVIDDQIAWIYKELKSHTEQLNQTFTRLLLIEEKLCASSAQLPQRSIGVETIESNPIRSVKLPLGD